MTVEQPDPHADDLPKQLGQPARRALIGAGCTRLAHVAERTEAELMQLHGFGPKGLEILRRALQANGLSFARSKRQP